jgi:hypothetical protein
LVVYYCNGYTPLPKAIGSVEGLQPSVNCISIKLV